MGYLKELGEIQIALREAKHQLEAVSTGLALSVSGKNAEERKAALAHALHTDREAVAANNQVRRLEADLIRMTARHDTWREERRAYEWSIRARLVDALERANSGAPRAAIADDGEAFTVAEDTAFDILTGEVFDVEGVPF